MIRRLAARACALIFLALAFAGVGTTPALAACPYTGNSSGLDTSAMLNALNDICAGSLSGNARTGVVATTTGGATPYHLLSVANTNPTLISTGAHTLYSLSAINTTGTIYYLKFYDQVAAPSTCGTQSANVKMNFPIPASASGAGFNINFGSTGIAFVSGLAFCITGGQADNDTSVAAIGISLNVGYK